MMELKARNKDIRIVQEFETTMPRLFADERAVRQITLNLLQCREIHADRRGARARRLTAGGGQYLSIRDNGPGHSWSRNPGGAVRLRPGLDSHQDAEQGTGLGLRRSCRASSPCMAASSN